MVIRKKINKHLGNNCNANSLAYDAIQRQASIKRDCITFTYNKDKNRLYIDDGFTTQIYEPLITEDTIDPFYKLIDTKM